MSSTPSHNRDQKMHFWLACQELTFVDGEGQTGVTRVSNVMQNKDQFVNVLLMGRAQQQAQVTLATNLDDPKIQFLNAIFVSVSYLGHMTNEQFHKTDQVAGHG